MNAIHVARGGTYLVMQNLATYAAQAITFAILARLISLQEMGIMAVLLLVNGVSQTIATLGLPQASTKFIAETLSKENIGGISSISYQSLRATLILSSPFALGVFLGARILSVQLLGEPRFAVFFQILAVDILLNAGVLPVLSGIMLGLQKFKESAIVSFWSMLVRQALIILLILMLKNFVGLVIAWVAGDIVSLVLFMRYVGPVIKRPRFDFSLRTLLKFSLPLWVGTAVSFVSSWFDRAVLLLFVSLATLGVYNATLTAFNVLGGITTALMTPLLPMYSALQGEHQRRALGNAVRLASRYISFVIIPLTLGLVATAKPALRLFLGIAYVPGTEPLMILSGTLSLGLFGIILTPLLLARGETREYLAITVISVVFSLLVALILLPLWGITGAALARGLNLLLEAVLVILILHRKTPLGLDLGAIAKSLIAGGVMAVIVYAVSLRLTGNLSLLPEVVIGGLVYLAMLRVLRAARQEDFDIMRNYLGDKVPWSVDLLKRILL